MTLFDAFDFVYKHNEQVIAVLFGLIVLTGAIFFFRGVAGADDGAGSDSSSRGFGRGVDLKALEDLLQKTLQNPNLRTQDAAAGGGGAGLDVNAMSEAQLAAMAQQGQGADVSAAAGEASGASGGGGAAASGGGGLDDKDRKIADLQAQLAHTQTQLKNKMAEPGGDSQASVEQQARLKELEARLAEYSIIEDDIADLTQFKEENTRLKEEVETLKSTVTQLQSAPAAAAPASAVGGGEMAAGAAASSAPPADELKMRFEKAEKFGLDHDDDIMKEFAMAVSGEGSAPPPPSGINTTMPAEAVAPIMEAASAPSAAPTPTAASAREPVHQSDIDAMFNAAIMAQEQPPAPTAESSSSAVAAASEPFGLDGSSAEGSAAEGSSGQSGDFAQEAIGLDADKVLAEAASLAETEGDDAPLEETLDTDKLLNEATALDEEEQIATSSPSESGGTDLFEEFAHKEEPDEIRAKAS